MPDTAFSKMSDGDLHALYTRLSRSIAGHCGACHTPRGFAYEERGYDESALRFLTSGINDHWFAPNLTGDAGSGLGPLLAIAHYLESLPAREASGTFASQDASTQPSANGNRVADDG